MGSSSEGMWLICSRVLKAHIFHSFRLKLQHELNEDDFDGPL